MDPEPMAIPGDQKGSSTASVRRSGRIRIMPRSEEQDLQFSMRDALRLLISRHNPAGGIMAVMPRTA